MSENNQTKNCGICGKLVIATPSAWVHEGAGTVEQKCRKCGWSGGQVGKFINCPRCGDATELVDDHTAS
mgnify:CR=1 FL=1